MIQEADLIELLDPAGKRTGQETTCIKPHAWALLGTQLPIYIRGGLSLTDVFALS